MSKKGLSARQENIIIWTIAVVMSLVLFYVVFMNIYTRVNHPEYTETQILIKMFNWGYTP